MTDKNSRYRTDPAVAGPDAHGRITLAHEMRPLPVATGTFRHVLAAGDRVDQLADRYYGNPMAWWQICDANPEFLSPWELFGQEPIVTFAFTIMQSADQRWEELWRRLFDALSDLPGVERITVVDSGEGRPSRHRIAVSYNRLTTSGSLHKIIAAAGLTLEEASPLSRLGKEIVIPPVEGG
ncbi:MAG: hypothetical protein ACM4D3_22105 [Candidatus Sericytochromatia bacterium]